MRLTFGFSYAHACVAINDDQDVVFFGGEVRQKLRWKELRGKLQDGFKRYNDVFVFHTSTSPCLLFILHSRNSLLQAACHGQNQLVAVRYHSTSRTFALSPARGMYSFPDLSRAMLSPACSSSTDSCSS